MLINDTNLWLKTAADLVVRDFLAPAGYVIKALPPIAMGWPGADLPWNAAASTAYDHDTSLVDHITISAFNPSNGREPSGAAAAAVLAHELIHVAISPTFNDVDDHVTPEFRALMDRIGLMGDPHATYASPRFERWVDEVLAPEYERRLKVGDVVTM